MLQGIDLACERGERTLFSGLHLELGAGEMLRLSGANGSGKTSLLRILTGLSQPAYGEVRWDKTNIGELAEDYRRQLTYIGHRDGLQGDLTAMENLWHNSRLFRPLTPSDAADALNQAGIGHCTHIPVKYLSQGQRRRVALSRLALADTPLWILDEPFTALDKNAVGWLLSLINQHLDDAGLLVLTSHQAVDIDAARMREVNLGS